MGYPDYVDIVSNFPSSSDIHQNSTFPNHALARKEIHRTGIFVADADAHRFVLDAIGSFLRAFGHS